MEHDGESRYRKRREQLIMGYHNINSQQPSDVAECDKKIVDVAIVREGIFSFARIATLTCGYSR